MSQILVRKLTFSQINHFNMNCLEYHLLSSPYAPACMSVKTAQKLTIFTCGWSFSSVEKDKHKLGNKLKTRPYPELDFLKVLILGYRILNEKNPAVFRNCTLVQ